MRPTRDAAEREEWDRLMDAHHYLGFRCLFGRGLRHVAEAANGRWVAFVGWAPGAFKVEGAGRVDRLGAGAAVPAAAPGGKQHALPDPAGVQRRQPGVAGAVAVAAPAVGGHAGGAGTSGAAGGDVRGLSVPD